MKPLIIANWKENPTTQKEAVELFNAVKKGVEGMKNAEVVICPPFVYLAELKGLTFGAQNVFYKEKGAFTGEVSPLMLKDLNVKYVIVGHSEVRKNSGETDEIIRKKIQECLAVGLSVILCVGEKEGEDKMVILEKQLKMIQDSRFKMQDLVVAYEPIWAIGSGNNCTIEETQASVKLIKKIISNEAVKVLYGGSVNSANAADYLENGGVNGLLVGGASLDATEFIKIVESA